MSSENAKASEPPLSEIPERSGVVPDRGSDPEVIARAQRRRFTAEYKARIVAEADACRERRTAALRGI